MQDWKYADDNNCIYNEDGSFTNPVHQHEDKTWWFYDEVWCQERGPFNTEKLANESCKLYSGEL